MNAQEAAHVEVLDDTASLGLIEIISYTHVERAVVIEMVDAGLLEPVGNAVEQWRFAARDVRRLRAAQRLVGDLGVNLSGAAVILDLLEERDRLLKQLATLNRLSSDG